MIKQTIIAMVISVFASAFVAVPTTVSATTPSTEDITIRYDNWGEAKPGTVVSLGSREVANNTYNVTVVTKNQYSKHPGNNLIVSSGASRVEVKDIESTPYVTLTATGVLKVTNGKIDVNLYVGSDGKYSTGVDLVLKKATCQTNPEMEVCKPVMIEVCKLSDMTKVTIKETDFNTKDYSKDLAKCKKPEVPVVKTIEVCKLSDMTKVTIDEAKFDNKLYSKDLTNCKKPVVTTPTPKPVTAVLPAEITKTGMDVLPATLAGLLGAVTYGVTYLRRR